MNDTAAPGVPRNRAAAIVVGGLTVAGVVTGVLWSVLAPPARGVVALSRTGNVIRAYLGAEADHLFVAAFLLVGMLSVVAVVAAVLVWQWRAHRGPVMVAALSVGAALAAGAAAAVGALVAGWRYGVIDVGAAPVSPENRVHYVIEAPPVFFGYSPLQIAATIVFPAAAAALVYALMVVATPRDDLGGWPPQERAVYPPAGAAEPTGITDQAETGADAQPAGPSSPSP